MLHVNANQILFLFFSKYKEYGMKSVKTNGIIVVDLDQTMHHSFYITHIMNDNKLTCLCEMMVEHTKRTVDIKFSPKNKFDIFNLILPCNQDPAIIQKTYNMLHQELSKSTFNCTYTLTYDQLAKLHTEYFDGHNQLPQPNA